MERDLPADRSNNSSVERNVVTDNADIHCQTGVDDGVQQIGQALLDDSLVAAGPEVDEARIIKQSLPSTARRHNCVSLLLLAVRVCALAFQLLGGGTFLSVPAVLSPS